MKIAYIAGPYTHESLFMRAINIHEAKQVAKKYWKLGYAVICPHMNSAHLDDYATPEHFIKSYLQILSKCDVIVMMPKWEKSKGAIEEYKYALEKVNMTIIHESKEE